MYKTQLIEKVAALSNTSKSVAERVIDGLGAVITDALKSGDEVSLVGVGKIAPVTRAPRTVSTPMIGAPVHVPSRKSAKFAPSAVLKRALNP